MRSKKEQKEGTGGVEAKRRKGGGLFHTQASEPSRRETQGSYACQGAQGTCTNSSLPSSFMFPGCASPLEGQNLLPIPPLSAHSSPNSRPDQAVFSGGERAASSSFPLSLLI